MIKKSIRKGIGIILIIFGFISLFLPIFPGIILIFLGFQLLGFGFIFQDKIKKFLKKDKKGEVGEKEVTKEENEISSS